MHTAPVSNSSTVPIYGSAPVIGGLSTTSVNMAAMYGDSAICSTDPVHGYVSDAPANWFTAPMTTPDNRLYPNLTEIH
jgi:hypothetical protein